MSNRPRFLLDDWSMAGVADYSGYWEQKHVSALARRRLARCEARESCHLADVPVVSARLGLASAVPGRPIGRSHQHYRSSALPRIFRTS